MVRPLDGVRVLDLTRLLPGAYATLLLADLGADVIKLEDPRGGDPMRRMPPLAVDGTSVYFHVFIRNKRSMTLDLRSPDAAAVFDALVSRVDVVVDSFRPRTAVRLGVDGATLRARHPRLICAAITGFGRSGPYSDVAAHDINYEALIGLVGRGERPPQVPPLLVADIGSALQAASGILAALFQRERTGAGAVIDTSIHEAALAWMLFPGAAALMGGAQDNRGAVPLDGEAACYNVYAAADDRYVALGALEPKFWAAFCERIGRPDLAPLQAAQGEDRARVLVEVRAIMRTRTRDEWLAAFAGVDACLTPVNSFADALADPHLRERGVLVADGAMTWVAPPGIEIRPAPSLGADTDDVLDQAGIGAPERARLRALSVLGS